MRKAWHLTISGVLLCMLVMLPFASGCQSEEGILNLWDTGPLTLDPAISGEMTSHTYITQLFGGLVRLDKESRPAPDIAKSWQKNSDGKTYTFYLNEGVRFHDGREVTAQDFKYSWERACNPKTKSQTAATYLGDIVGANSMLEGKATEIKGIEIINDYTLKVTIDTPKAYFLSKLTYPTAFVVDKANVESSKEWWHKPNGTGPFKLKEWKEDQLLVLEPNKDYHQEPPKINQIVFHLLAGMPMALYETGAIDVASVYAYHIERVTDENGPFFKELAVFPESSLFYIGFNTHKPPFDDINVRQAFCHAVNKERIIKTILKGMVTKADGILPPNMPGHNESLVGLNYDVAKAKNLIANSKYGSIDNLPPITLTTSGQGGNIHEYLGAIIQDWQQNLGIEVTVRQLEPKISSFPITLKQEVDEIFTYGWIADYQDPQNFLDNLFHTGAGYNTGDYSNPDLDALLDHAAIEPDYDARLALYQQGEQKIIEEAACLPLWFGSSYLLIKPYVKNYELDAQGIPTLSQVHIEKGTYSLP